MSWTRQQPDSPRCADIRSAAPASRPALPARGRRREGGYAILAILLGAVLASIFLVRALPREAMSAQRIREERLIDRGEQYARAIKLYFREHQKYPEELDDLEDTNGVRYLRKRYKDPMTGEDEWRLIHIGTDGRFKDSLIYDTEDPEEMADGRMGAGGSGFGGQSRNSSGFGNRPNPRSQGASATAYQALYGAAAAPPGVFQGASRARQVRESAAPDNPLERPQGPGGEGGQQPAGDPNDPESAGLGPDGLPLPLDQQQPVDYSNLPPGQVPEDAGQRPQTGQQGYPTQPTGGFGYSLPQSRGAIANRGGNRGGVAQQQQPGGPTGPIGMQNVSQDAASIIGRLLTTPRPGGLAGIQGQGGAGMQQGQQGMTFQEGVAGVASKSQETGAVKVYKGMTTYQEWEFVYDYRQDTGVAGMPGAQGPAGNVNPNQPGLTPGGTLSGVPGGMPQIPGLPGAPPAGVAPPRGPDPRQTQFGGGASTPSLPATMPQPSPDPYPTGDQPTGQDGSTPEDPVQPEPPVPAPAPATQTPGQNTGPGRTYSLPPSRVTQPNR